MDRKIQNDSRELYESIQHDAEGSVLDCPYNLSDEFWIFDAQNLAQGPICRVGHPDLNMPLTLHSLHVDSLPSGDSYQISIYDDYSAQIAGLDESIIALFEAEVFTRFS